MKMKRGACLLFLLVTAGWFISPSLADAASGKKYKFETALLYNEDKSAVFVNLSIAPNLRNKEVYLWEIVYDCSPSLNLMVPSGVGPEKDLCGTTKQVYSQSYYDANQGVSLLTASVINTGDSRGVATFTLAGYYDNDKTTRKVFDKKTINLKSRTTATKPEESRVRIISPNGGEKIVAGKITKINFASSLGIRQVDSFDIKLFKKVDGSTEKVFVQDIVLNWERGSPYEWLVPSSLVPGDYFLNVSVNFRDQSLNEPAEDFSDNSFTVSNSRPFIRIFNPGKTSQYRAGSYAGVVFDYFNLKGTSVQLYLQDVAGNPVGDGTTYKLPKKKTGVGELNFNFEKETIPGEYKFVVCGDIKPNSKLSTPFCSRSPSFIVREPFRL